MWTTTPTKEEQKITDQEFIEQKADLDLEFKKISVLNEILEKVNSYLVGRTGQKQTNATKAKENISNLLKSDKLDPDIFKKISEILNTWEQEDNDLSKTYWISEITSGTQTTITKCREILEHCSPGCTKQDEHSSKNNSPQPILHAFTSTTNIEEQLFSLLYNEKFDKFKQLIEQNPQGYKIDATDKNGETLLHHAAVTLDARFLTLLLQLGANPNIGDRKEKTPVHWTVYGGILPNVSLFINNAKEPVDWNKQTSSGTTILMFARQGKTEHDHGNDCQHDMVIEEVTKAISKPTNELTTQQLN